MKKPREATCKLREMIDDGLVDKDDVLTACLEYMSEQDVADMMQVNGYIEHDDESEQEND